MIFLLSLFVALLPVFFWYVILIRSHRKGMKFFFFLVFFIAAAFAFFWKIFFEDAIEEFSRPILGIFFTYIILGVMIEYGKNFIIRIIGKNYFKGIDDVVDLAFATALGFTCMENILYFYELFSHELDYGRPIFLIKEVLKQEFFILPIHLFCSGIFGYFYGVSLFATDKDGNIIQSKIFNSFQILKGTVISTGIYGLFFMLKELDPGVQDVAFLFGYEDFLFGIDEKLLPIISYFFFSLGSLYLFHLMDQKRYLVKPKKLKLKT